jgi:hypothetical protein
MLKPGNIYELIGITATRLSGIKNQNLKYMMLL